MNRKRLILSTALVAVAGFSVSFALVFRPDPGERTALQWAEVYEHPAELARAADVILVGRPISTQASRTVVSDNGGDELPFEAVEFVVESGWKGVASGSRVFVERAGGLRSDGSYAHIDADGGPFAAGTSYLLFLRWQPGTGMAYQINDQARYEVADGFVLADETEDLVTASLHGKTLAVVAADVAGWLK